MRRPTGRATGREPDIGDVSCGGLKMQQACIARYTVKSGTVDEIVRRIKASLVPIYRRQPGFVAFELIKTSNASLIAVSMWHLAEYAATSAKMTTAWTRQEIGENMVSVDYEFGDLEFFWIPFAQEAKQLGLVAV